MLESNPPQFVVRRGPNPDHVYTLAEETSIVGREPINDMVLPDPEVSRRHARIVLRKGIYHIEDLSSTNGTYINGRRISSLTPLADGDIIDFGETIRVVFNWKRHVTSTGEKLHPESKKYGDSSIFESSAPFPVPQRKESNPALSVASADPIKDEIDLAENDAWRGDAETISEINGGFVSPSSVATQTTPLTEPEIMLAQEPTSAEASIFADRRYLKPAGCAVILLGLCTCGGIFFFLDANYPNVLYSWLPA